MVIRSNRNSNKKTHVALNLYLLKYAVRICLIVVLFAQAISGVSNESRLPQKESLAQENDPLGKEEIQSAEHQLAELGYWTGKIDGVLDSASRYALTAFQKAEGRKPSGALTREEFAAILLARRLLPRESHYAHVEVDLARQILFRVDGAGKVSHILPISSGNGELFTSEGYTRRAVTPVGRFTVYNQIKGWRRSPLGLLYYPNYILSGIAIHGSLSVPVRPASHGCIRIPMFAAEEFSRLTPIGTVVVVHNDTPVLDHP
jgi:peptidoglycan hydrolase-like protein with peptidoglycan-binding domain